MTKKKWREEIRRCCQDAGTYRPYFDNVIETLATILEQRDKAQQLFKKSGGNPIVQHTNKGGNTNNEQNPLIRLINDLNRDALSYWRDLGLTPAGLKKIDEKALAAKKRSALAEALKELS